MQKCVQTGRAIDAKANCVEIGISGEIAKTVRGLMMREGVRARGTSERACSSGMSRRRRMANRISSGSCSSAELQVLVIGRSSRCESLVSVLLALLGLVICELLWTDTALPRNPATGNCPESTLAKVCPLWIVSEQVFSHLVNY